MTSAEDETFRDEDEEAALSGCALTMATDSGAATVIDAKDQLASIKSPDTIRPALGKVAKIFTVSGRITEVNQEQIDRVRMMHDRFSSDTRFSFNYNTLLLVASIIAGLGLVSNSSTTIIASMLVSPIMGPVVGMSYGTTIFDWRMVRRSARTECVSLLVCIIVGCAIGAITGVTQLAADWPTDEMKNRCNLETFLVALPVAFFSGLGVAVSLLDEQTNSLVGVAISASLLPPAVNCGVMWVAYAFVKNDVIPLPATPVELGSDGVTGDEVPDTNEKWFRMGILSLLLTLSNILLIWISAVFMFRMKEVLPIEKKVFWDDLKVARKIYQHKAVVVNGEVGASKPTYSEREEDEVRGLEEDEEMRALEEGLAEEATV